MVYLSFLFFVTVVPFGGILIIESIRRRIIKWLKKHDNTPKVFEFLFFLFLFLATLFATFMAMYGGSVSTHENVITFLQYNWLWMSSYGLAIVFGIYHYIERLDIVDSYDEFGVKKMSEKEVKIKWDTGKKTKEYDLLNADYLHRVGIDDVTKIKSVKPFFAFPEKPYTEEGVARKFHPLLGSGGAEIETIDGRTALIEELFYYDYGHKKGDLKDTPHYNKEGRFTDIDGHKEVTCDVEDHVISNPTEYMNITLTTPSGSKQTQKIYGW
jgi:hypothetical protein